MVVFSSIAVGAALSLVPAVRAHIGVWAPGMYCLNGPQTAEDLNSHTVVNPLYDLAFSDYFFGNGVTNGKSNQCYNYPPAEGEFLEVPANGSFDVEFASNRAFTSLSWNGKSAGKYPDGQAHPELDAPDYFDANCPQQPLLHATSKADVAGMVFAIAYVSDYKDLTQENLAVFSANHNVPWVRQGSFQVPNLPACPDAGCLCASSWVPNNCGQPNEYLQLFKCKVTGAKADAPAVAPPKAPVWCEGNPDACTKGSKQLVYYHQKEKNNINVDTGTGRAGEEKDGQQKSPGYNMKLGFQDGAQHDIFVDGGSSAAPASSASSAPAKASASPAASPAASSAASPAAHVAAKKVDVVKAASAASNATQTAFAAPAASSPAKNRCQRKAKRSTLGGAVVGRRHARRHTQFDEAF